VFAAANTKFEEIKETMSSKDWEHATHDELERYAFEQGCELMRQLIQGHLELRARGEATEPVVGADGVERTHRRGGTRRELITRFGSVDVERPAYGGRGVDALHPTDAELNVPTHIHSHELERLVALTSAQVSFERTAEMVAETTGVGIPKRQVEMLSRSAAQDVPDFYTARTAVAETQPSASVLVLSFDQKGIVMRPEDLLPETRKRAARRSKLETRLTKGEPKGRKRMATVAAIYAIAPDVRDADAVLAGLRRIKPVGEEPRKRPKAQGKRVWATLERPLKQVVSEGFDEGERRDPTHLKQWVVVIDGDPKLLKAVRAEANRRDIQVSTVAAGMRRSATKRGLDPKARAPIDNAADYILGHKAMMHYDAHLAAGWPIASGVIEGTCRTLVNDRLDITGACWRLEGAEAVLRLRAVLQSGDFDDYWDFHLDREYERNHASRYADGLVPKVANPKKYGPLRVIK